MHLLCFCESSQMHAAPLTSQLGIFCFHRRIPSNIRIAQRQQFCSIYGLQFCNWHTPFFYCGWSCCNWHVLISFSCLLALIWDDFLLNDTYGITDQSLCPEWGLNSRFWSSMKAIANIAHRQPGCDREVWNRIRLQENQWTEVLAVSNKESNPKQCSKNCATARLKEVMRREKNRNKMEAREEICKLQMWTWTA